MKSSLINMVLTLFLITLASAALLGVIYSVTKEPIMAARAEKTTGALGMVLPEFDNNPVEDTVNMVIDDLPVTVYTARKGGSVVGYAVESSTMNGFSGEIRIMTGFGPNGDIYNIEVLQHAETPGLGSKMADPDNVLLVSFQGKNPAELKMTVKKDGGDIDALTASTITSRAYAEAVERAYSAYRQVALGEEIETVSIDHVEAVLPEYDNDPYETVRTVEVNQRSYEIYTGMLDGQVVGYAVNSFTSRGFKDGFTLMVGFMPDGTVSGISVVKQHETPGYGSQIEEPGNDLELSFVGKDPSKLNLKLSHDGGDIDGISGSTITSEGYIDAVKLAHEAFREAERNGL